MDSKEPPRRLERAPLPLVTDAPETEKFIAFALKAMNQGNANAEQQHRLLSWVIHDLCRSTDNSYYSSSDRDTAFACGKAFIGQQLLGLINADPKALERVK